VLKHRQWLGHRREDKRISLKIKGCVTTMDRPVMIRADEGEVLEVVGASPAKPTDMMGLA
jgi:hypothetical protein